MRRDWTTAQNALKKSLEFNGGKADDWFFLAMTYWNSGNHSDARQYFDQAVAAMKKSSQTTLSCIRFHAEAAALLGLACPKAGVGVARKGSNTAETMQN